MAVYGTKSREMGIKSLALIIRISPNPALLVVDGYQRRINSKTPKNRSNHLIN
jgi:hypothetical protein